MHCLTGCLALSAPRFVLLLVFLFSDYLGRAYETNLWPFLGFLFLPLTTLAYAFAINSTGEVSGLHLALVITAGIVDLGLFGTGRRRHKDPPEPRAPGPGAGGGGPTVRTIDVEGRRVG